ncbi:MAG: HesA/MoeB/ThiF family protein [Bacteroidales bacterium]
MEGIDFSMERYRQQMNIVGFGHAGQERLSRSKVLVVGAGGIGCPVLMYLCSMGVGHITVVDGDRVDISNLHRQVLYNADDIGQLKVHVVKRKLSLLNPNVQITPIDVFLTHENALELSMGYDVIIEGTDQPVVRFICDDVSRKLGMPYVYGSIYQMQGQVAVFNYNGSLSYRDFFGLTDDTMYSLPICSDAGALPAVTGMIGSMMAGECVKLLTGIGDPLTNCILFIDFRHNHYIRFVKEKACSENTHRNTLHNQVQVITPAQLQEWFDRKLKFQLLDVRELFERQVAHIGGEHIPYSHFDQEQINIFQANIPLVIYCQHGIRSAHVAEIFIRAGFQHVYSLLGGLQAYLHEMERL